jgi:hypothetical protein
MSSFEIIRCDPSSPKDRLRDEERFCGDAARPLDVGVSEERETATWRLRERARERTAFDPEARWRVVSLVFATGSVEDAGAV